LLLVLSTSSRQAVASGDDFDRPPINYSQETPTNIIERLRGRLDSGDLELPFEEHFGYLRPILRELSVSKTSQTLVYSKTSLQRRRIGPRTPRSLYFSDDVYVSFCQSGDVLEISAADPKLGTVFYTLEQDAQKPPRLNRQGDSCLICHASSATRGVPGHLLRSVFVDRTGEPIFSAANYRINHTTPFKHRWGGWYVTGTHGLQSHLGNLIAKDREGRLPVDNPQGMNVTDLSRRIDIGSLLTPHSDLIALMVLAHQAEGHNVLTRANFQTRLAFLQEEEINRLLGKPASERLESTARQIASAADEIVQCLMFSGETPLSSPIRGTSSFAEEFATIGPRDKHGRSLREFDLQRRLFKYPCSYLIYTESFDALPQAVRECVGRRFDEVLSGRDNSKAFFHLSPADREAIRDILRDTKPSLTKLWNAQ